MRGVLPPGATRIGLAVVFLALLLAPPFISSFLLALLTRSLRAPPQTRPGGTEPSIPLGQVTVLSAIVRPDIPKSPEGSSGDGPEGLVARSTFSGNAVKACASPLSSHALRQPVQ